MFKINYHTRAGNTTAETLAEAMVIADEGAAYTQEPITIHDTDGDIVATRTWYGSMDGIEDEINPISFGNYGFYADWITD